MKLPRCKQHDLGGYNVGQGVELAFSPSVDELEGGSRCARSPSDDCEGKLLELGVELLECQIPLVDKELSERLVTATTLGEEHECTIVLGDSLPFHKPRTQLLFLYV